MEIDPDSREFEGAGVVSRSTKIQKAIVDSSAERVKLYLTKSPYCSSTLKPVDKNLRRFTYHDLFEVLDTCELPSMTLNDVADQIGCGFDWVKLDTQGTELRLLKSLDPTIFDQILCCDADSASFTTICCRKAFISLMCPKFKAVLE